MTRDPRTIRSDETLEAARALMTSLGLRHLPVLDAGKLVGVLSDRDLITAEKLAGAATTTMRVSDVPLEEPFSVDIEMSLYVVAQSMAERKLGSAIVLEDGKVVGIFTAVDACLALAEVTRSREKGPVVDKRRSILIVDDEAALLDVFQRALCDEFHVVTARTVDQAWPFVEGGVDILICDLQLNGESGMALLRRASTARKIPRMIAISAVATPTDAFALATAGALVFLEKPFSNGELRHAIELAERSPALEPIVAAQLGIRTLSEVEGTVRQTMVKQAVALSGGNQQRAARMLGLTRQRVNQILKGK